MLNWRVNNYERIADIIQYLDKNFTDQSDLAKLASRAKMSPFHFHRLFSSWAGVTPKDFLQCLTLAHVKKQLRKGKSILDAALDSGLSKPSRLHGLCIYLEAASPDELKSGGKGWRITFGFAESPFGKCLIAESPRGICHLSFSDFKKNGVGLTAIQKDWPYAKLHRDDSHAAKLAGRIFTSAKSASTNRSRTLSQKQLHNRSHQINSNSSPLRAFVKGTAFQVRVWRTLLNVPQSTLTTYGHLAKAVGKPTATRAVGSAVGKNPVAYLIPCHRVIRETGVTGEYHWGKIRKRAIIAWENLKIQNHDANKHALN